MSVGHASFFVSNLTILFFVFRIVIILTRLHDGLSFTIDRVVPSKRYPLASLKVTYCPAKDNLSCCNRSRFV